MARTGTEENVNSTFETELIEQWLPIVRALVQTVPEAE
jgi:hypothetical protein